MSDFDVQIYTASGETDAQQVRAFLEAHEIASELRGEALRNVIVF